jgi:hypothetical protein
LLSRSCPFFHHNVDLELDVDNLTEHINGICKGTSKVRGTGT